MTTARSLRVPWLRVPGIHFFLLGGLLYGLRMLLPAAPIEHQSVVFSAQRIDDLRQALAQRWGRPPIAEQLAAAIQQAVDDELLEREARRLGLSEGDLTVRQRLITKMRAVAEDPALDDDELLGMALDLGFDDDIIVRRLLRQKMRLLLQRDPGGQPMVEEDLVQALDRHRNRFLLPATVSFRHVFLNSELNDASESPNARAQELATQIRDRRLSPDEALELSDPFPLALQAKHQTRIDVARRFGEAFADCVMALLEASWSKPLISAYGQHLVWVDERRDERLPAIDTVRQPLLRILEEERAVARLAAGLERLRHQQPIVIDWPDELATEVP